MQRLIAILLLLALFLAPVGLLQAEDFSDENLQFSVEGGKMYFFQPRTGRVFVYQVTTNRFSRLITLEELGQDLTQSRTLIIKDEESEY